MISLGVLLLFFGGCLGLTAAALPSMQIPPDMAANLKQLEAQTHLPAQMTFYLVAGLVAAVALEQIVMGILVRRARRWALLTAIIITTILGSLWVLQFVGGLAFQGANISVGVGMILFSLCLLAWELSWLLQALHAARNATAMHASLAQPMMLTNYPPEPPDPSPIGWPYPPPPK